MIGRDDKREKASSMADLWNSLVMLLIRYRVCGRVYPSLGIEIKNALAVGETAGRFDYHKSMELTRFKYRSILKNTYGILHLNCCSTAQVSQHLLRYSLQFNYTFTLVKRFLQRSKQNEQAGIQDFINFSPACRQRWLSDFSFS